MRRGRLWVSLLAIMLLITAAPSWAAPISVSTVLSDWTQTNGIVSNYNNALWQESGGNLWNGGNRAGAIVSDFSTAGDFSFSADLMAAGDNDLMGIVFGFQDYNNGYALSWGGGGVGPYNGIHVYKDVGGTLATVASNPVLWASGLSYGFSVTQSGNEFTVGIDQGATNIFSHVFTDSQFTTGSVGFDTWSQSTYFEASSIDYSPVPEPATMLLLGTGLLGLAGIGRKRGK